MPISFTSRRAIGQSTFARRLLLAGVVGALGLQTAPAMSQTTQGLPSSVRAALAEAHLPASALSLWVAPTSPQDRPLYQWQADRPWQPASLAKLVTSAAALEVLGPTYQWSTTLVLDRRPVDGVLDGSVYIQGGGDPHLVPERLQALLMQLQRMGVRHIRGDIVLDRSAYALAQRSPADFDGQADKPYNVLPDALLINQHSLTLTFTPDPARGVARVDAQPPLSGWTADTEVPLSSGACGDWRSGLGADLTRPDRLTFTGRYPLSCAQREWPIAHADPRSYGRRAVDAAWRVLGGRLEGQVRDGLTPSEVKALAESEPSLTSTFASPSLPEILRDTNKYSNNTMAQQVLLALSPERPARLESARSVAASVLVQRAGCSLEEVGIDNGSGLSRDERLSTRCLGTLLRWAWNRPWMPEFVAALPVAGLDGTARRLTGAAGRAHLKTGSLRNVNGIAGYVHRPDGSRLVVVAVFNQPGIGGAASRGVFNALLRELAPGTEAPAPNPSEASSSDSP